VRNINNNPCESCTAEFCENCKVSSAQPAQKNRVTQERIIPELVEDEYDEFNRDWEYLGFEDGPETWDPGDDYRLGTDPAEAGYMRDWGDDPDSRDFGYPDDIEDDYWHDYEDTDFYNIPWNDVQNNPPDQDTLSPKMGNKL